MKFRPKYCFSVTHGYWFFLISGLLIQSFWGTQGLGLIEVAYAGTIEGAVHYLGVVPQPQLMTVTKDQDHCGVGVSVQTINVHDAHGALSGVVVSIGGVKNEDFLAAKKDRRVLNMRCAFEPRIGVARQSEEIEVRNQDPILHNTHIKLGKRTVLNVAQVPGGKPIVKRLKRSGLHTVRCDKHIFMESYLYVFNHPYYDLTDQTGTFRISGIPPGKHAVQVWHETLGFLEKVVNIPKEGTVRFDFSYP